MRRRISQIQQTALPSAPELSVTRWFNSPEPLTLAQLRGRVVLLHAFQMLCPGCVAHATPQAERAHVMFRNTDLQVIGIHTVFEHHAAMTPVSLEAFIHEYHLSFPIGVDAPGDGTLIPITMGRYGMRGTPTSILVDRNGTIRHHAVVVIDDRCALLGIVTKTDLLSALARIPHIFPNDPEIWDLKRAV